MKSRNVLYIVITIICVISIVVAVYYQVFKSDENLGIPSNNVNNSNIANDENIDLEKIKNEFNNLFTNELYLQGNDVTNVQKANKDKEIIYLAYKLKEENEIYNVNINLPVFNITGDITGDFNKTTQSIFANKANEVLIKTEGYTIYNVEYVAYVNENIISLAIKSTLKEGQNAQRVIVQTYNYNLETGKEVTLNEVLEQKNINKSEVNKKIEKVVSLANTQAEAIAQATSQTIYKRDLNSAMYITDNTENFMLGADGKIYIVYAYGNSNFTSEMDIIIVE